MKESPIIVVGSFAFDYCYGSNNVLGRNPRDIDLIATIDQCNQIKQHLNAKIMYPINRGEGMFLRHPETDQIIDVELVWPNSKALHFVEEFFHKFPEAFQNGYLFDTIPVYYARPHAVYMMKLSHRFKKNSPHFLKTMTDIQKMRKMGLSLIEKWKPFLADRERLTYNYKHPDLQQSKDEFFNSETTGVIQTYDHDSVHVAIAIGEKPAYLSYMKDDHPVQCDKQKFRNCSYETQLFGVIEESMVLAIERSLVPFNGRLTPEEAFRFALKKVCTSITSGWFREFAWENHDAAIAKFLELEQTRPYWEYFKQQVSNDKVKLKE